MKRTLRLTYRLSPWASGPAAFGLALAAACNPTLKERRRSSQSADAIGQNLDGPGGQRDVVAFTPHYWNPRSFVVSYDDGGAQPNTAFEITPLVLSQPGNYEAIIILPGGFSLLCAKAVNLTRTSNVELHKDECRAVSLPATGSEPGPNHSLWLWPPEAVQGNPLTWKYSYDGIFGAEIVGNRIEFVRHTETQNARAADPAGHIYTYQSPIRPNVDANVCHSGYDNMGDEQGEPDTYTHCWQSFDSFGASGSLPYSQAITTNGTSMAGLAQPEITEGGPIFWSQYGYRAAPGGDKIGTHPTLLRDGDYLYAFTSGANPSGFGYPCLTAARAPIGSGPIPATAWRLLDQAGDFLTPSLPAHFDRWRIGDFYDTAGPSITCLFPDEDLLHSQNGYLNVARLWDHGTFTGYYAGVYSRFVFTPAPGHEETLLRISRDLVHWSPPQLIFPIIGGGWGKNYFTYPTLIAREGSSNHDVERCDFSIMGKHVPDPNHVQIADMAVDIAGLPGCATASAATQPISIELSVNGQLKSYEQVVLQPGTPADIWVQCGGATTWGKLVNNLDPPWSSEGVHLHHFIPGDQPSGKQIHYWAKCAAPDGRELNNEIHLVWSDATPQ